MGCRHRPGARNAPRRPRRRVAFCKIVGAPSDSSEKNSRPVDRSTGRLYAHPKRHCAPPPPPPPPAQVFAELSKVAGGAELIGGVFGFNVDGKEWTVDLKV